MLEISGIQEQEGEDCIEIAHHICKTAKANIHIHKIEIAHRIMNGSIIVTFRDRPSRDLLFKNKFQLKKVTSEELGYEVHQKSYTSMNPWLLIRGSYYVKSKQNVGKSGTKGLSQTMG